MSDPITAVEPKLSAVVPGFLLYAEVERRFAKQSLIKYRDCLRQIQRILGDRAVVEYMSDDVLDLKANLLRRNLSVSREVTILASLKGLLQYCRERLHLATLPPEAITMPRRPRRDVAYLAIDEVERFVNSIKIKNAEGAFILTGLRFRALVEALLGSAMRIGELLSLNREQIEFNNREASIVGKGNKQRVVFFTDRALSWLKTYLEIRADDHPALFVTQGRQDRLKQTDIWRPFTRHQRLAGLSKRVTPHILRHTAATQLLFNGCPIGHIKEILGHERLETTCRYYLGLDHRAAKDAHQRYLVYERAST